MNAPFRQPGTLLDPGAPINQGLVGWWPMWEGAGGKTLDISGKNNHGTLTNEPLWSGGGLKFDATNDWVDVGADVRPSLPVSIHVRCMFRSTSAAGGLFASDKTNISTIIHSGFVLSQGFITAGKIALFYGDNTANNSTGRRTKSGTTTPSNNVVHSITGVIRGATDMSIWLNGIDDGGTYSGTGGSMVYRNDSGAIGMYSDTGGTLRVVNGNIFDCRVWSRALSALEVQQLYVNPNIGLWVPDITRYYFAAAAGGADVRRKIIPAYMRFAA